MTPVERWGVWTTSLLVILTGAGLGWAKYVVVPTDPFAVAHHPLEPWFLKVHIIVAPFLLLSVGSIAVRHVWAHVRSGRPRARRSGMLTAAVFGPMVLSGYLLQVLTSLGWIRAMALVHIAVGTLYGVGVVAHQAVVRRSGGGAAGAGRGGTRREPPGDGRAAPSMTRLRLRSLRCPRRRRLRLEVPRVWRAVRKVEPSSGRVQPQLAPPPDRRS